MSIRSKLTKRLKQMLPPWDSLSGLQSYQDWLTRAMIVAGVVWGVLFALSGGFLGWFQYKITNRIDQLQSTQQDAGDTLKKDQWPLGVLNTEQFDAMVLRFRKINAPNDLWELNVDVMCAEFPSLSRQFAAQLNDALVSGHLAIRGTPNEIAEAEFEGLTLYAEKDSENLRQIASALEITGIKPRISINEPTKIKIVGENVDDISEFFQRNRNMNPGHELVALVVGRVTQQGEPVSQTPARSWLNVGTPTLTQYEAGKCLRCIVPFSNSGPVPATVVSAGARFVLEPTGADIKKYVKEIHDWADAHPRSMVIAPDGAVFSQVDCAEKITQKQIEAVNSGKLTLYLVGREKYVGQGKDTHHLEYCFAYDPEHKKFFAWHEFNRVD